MQIADRDAYCCVYDVVGEREEYSSLASKGALSTMADDSISSTAPCFTRIAWTASDFSERVSSASRAAGASRTVPVGNEASSNSTPAASGSASGSASASGTGSEAASTSASASASGSSTSNAALPAVTARGLVLGGAAIAAALCVM